MVQVRQKNAKSAKQQHSNKDGAKLDAADTSRVDNHNIDNGKINGMGARREVKKPIEKRGIMNKIWDYLLGLVSGLWRVCLNIPFIGGALTSLQRSFSKLSYPMRVSVTIITVVAIWMLSGLFITHEHEKPYRLNLADRQDIVDPFFKVQLSSPQKYHAYLRVNGITAASRNVPLFSEVNGKVLKIVAQSGDYLRMGEPIILIEAQNRQEVLQQAEVTLQQAQTQAESVQALYDKKLASKLDLESSKSGLAEAEAKLKQANLDWQNTTISAPFDGLLDYLNVKEGDLIVPGVATKPIAAFLDLSVLKIQIHVPEANLQDVLLAKEATVLYKKATKNVRLSQEGGEDSDPSQSTDLGTRMISINRFDGQQTAAVTFVSKAIDSVDNTFMTELEINNSRFEATSGQNVVVEINIGEKIAHKLPQSTICLDESGNKVVKILTMDEIVQSFPVKIIGEDIDGMWLIGLPDEELNVIVLGQAYITDGTKLDIAKGKVG
jgi:membrane fusion protein, multidrug efflux system